MKLNLAGVAAKGAKAVLKVGRTSRSGSAAKLDEGSASSMFGGEDGDASSGPALSGNARFSMNDLTRLFGMSDFDNSRIYGGNAYYGDGFTVLAEDLSEAVAANLKINNGHSGNRGSEQSNARSENSGGGGSWTRGNGGYSTGNDGPGTPGTPTRVPEPNTVILFGTGMLGVAMLMKRQSGPGQL